MNDPSPSEPTPTPTQEDAEAADPGRLAEAADDPQADKQRTGEAQAAENRADEPPA